MWQTRGVIFVKNRMAIAKTQMPDLNWLKGLGFRSLVHREFDWAISFTDGTCLVIACLWRLIDSDRIAVTSNDDTQKFGLPTRVDSAAEVSSRLTNTSVSDVQVSTDTLDLEIHFGTQFIFQIIPDSSGFESWQLSGRNQSFVAQGGGQLVVFDGGFKSPSK